jgi:hypothetical protein
VRSGFYVGLHVTKGCCNSAERRNGVALVSLKVVLQVRCFNGEWQCCWVGWWGRQEERSLCCCHYRRVAMGIKMR